MNFQTVISQDKFIHISPKIAFYGKIRTYALKIQSAACCLTRCNNSGSTSPAFPSRKTWVI
jgi:hypothetical protein